ncbi:ankyrin repeat domain-containing protein [Paenibacillus psychroresistens]|uniref:Ankyrin repeat domain-containing protein n=1 Tax=Paenibacillus psychroresistens TaxID=1778678 RepID=A0A6B8RVH6_9BACL|nr:ankyrin repeat domain-containing protein [Paenibacillus psychroresistens]QGQ99286.1 ankyrin repeat domain-containing protein [Paenibacillus psychroresistens]
MPNKKQSIVISIRLDEGSLKAVDVLVESGLESNRSRAVTHFINIGIQSSEELLRKAQSLADNVHQLRNEMIEAVKINNLAKVTELISQDASLVNASNSSGETAVLMAAYYRSNEIKETLINNGAELNIFEASSVGNTQRVKQLLKKSPKLKGSYSADGFTPLGLAAHFGNEETVKLLLDQGADVNARSVDGNLNNMAIHAAIAGNYEHIVNLLIEHGADVNVKCEGEWRLGFSPLHVAGYFGRGSIIDVLLKAGAEKTAKNDNGETPYELAMKKEHQEIADLLK